MLRESQSGVSRLALTGTEIKKRMRDRFPLDKRRRPALLLLGPRVASPVHGRV